MKNFDNEAFLGAMVIFTLPSMALFGLTGLGLGLLLVGFIKGLGLGILGSVLGFVCGTIVSYFVARS